jgi:hypothetical protein
MTTDPVVRITAGAILAGGFFGALAVVVHGYWFNPEYQIPAVVSWVLGGAFSGALTLLGVHLGAIGTQAAVGQGARVVQQAVTNGVQTVDKAA